jgi:release factor glutamine methyltransferase
VLDRKNDLVSLLRDVRSKLARAGVPSAGVEAEILIAHVLGIARGAIYLDVRRPVTPDQHAEIMALAGRRARRIPLQHVLGEWEFMSLPFKMREGVFIPRPETEVLAESVVARAGRAGRPPRRILDVGTGTGVVAVALAVYLKPEFVLATDVSPLAVETARANAILNGVGAIVRFAVGDALGPIGPAAEDGFDVVVSNPPYVASGDIEVLEPEVRDHDPRQALDGGPGGLGFIAGLLPRIPSIMKRGGMAALEIGATQGDDVIALMEEAGFEEVELVKDLAGLDRVVLGRRS